MLLLRSNRLQAAQSGEIPDKYDSNHRYYQAVDESARLIDTVAKGLPDDMVLFVTSGHGMDAKGSCGGSSRLLMEVAL